MEINILSNKKIEKFNIKNAIIRNIIIKHPKSINPIYFFKLARFAKRCNVLHIHNRFGGLKGGLGINTSLFLFIVKFPAGPKIVVSLDKKSFFDYPYLLFCDRILRKKTPKDEIKKIYLKAFIDGGAGHPDSIYNLPLQRERLKWLKKNKFGEALEVGCATGYIINYVGGGTGLDVDKLRLGIARKNYPKCRFIYANATKMPFRNKEFDTVLVPEILEHVPFNVAKKIVKECERVGKKLLVTVPNADKKNYDKNLVENPEHKWLPTKQRTFQLLGRNIRIEYSKKKDFMFITKLC
jgi:hypothetical protein